MSKLTIGILIFILGIGVGWSFSQTKQARIQGVPTWYEEKIKSYLPAEFAKHKQVNYNLTSKFQG